MTHRSAEERIDELLLDRATEGLASETEAELERLLAEHPDLDDDGYELAAAAVELAAAEPGGEAMPEALRSRLESEGRRFVEDRPGRVARFPTPSSQTTSEPADAPRRSTSRTGWWAAAACLALAAIGWWLALQPSGPTSAVPDPEVITYELPAEIGTPSEQRLALLESGVDVVRWSWTSTEDPLGQGASGDVVWSPESQTGFMRFDRLAANDPQDAQYQLWIFDAVRDERYPVDGGVFDVPPGRDEVVVPIRAKLPVENATLFAVTLERPGGVVVSDRERLVLLAQAS